MGENEALNWKTEGDVLWDEIKAIAEKFPSIEKYDDEFISVYLTEIGGEYWIMVMLEEGEEIYGSIWNDLDVEVN